MYILILEVMIVRKDFVTTVPNQCVCVENSQEDRALILPPR